MQNMIAGEGVTVFANPRAAAAAEGYGQARSAILNGEGFDAAAAAIFV